MRSVLYFLVSSMARTEVMAASSTSQIQHLRKIVLAEQGRYRAARLIVFSSCGIDEGHGFIGRCQHSQIYMKAIVMMDCWMDENAYLVVNTIINWQRFQFVHELCDTNFICFFTMKYIIYNSNSWVYNYFEWPYVVFW